MLQIVPAKIDFEVVANGFGEAIKFHPENNCDMPIPLGKIAWWNKNVNNLRAQL